jgi:sulfotransferase family protein
MTSSTEARVPRLHGAHRVPDFFIVGHHKSGTTALYEMLRRHPQIYMPSLKEPRYMASDLRALVPDAPSSRLPQTLEQYLELFDPAGEQQLAGEASPSYLRSQTAAGAIAELQPDARIVAILREPASFVRSLHLQLCQEHVELERDLGQAIAAEAIERGGRHVRRYADHVHYAEQLRRYEAAFAPEQLLVLIYDDFRAENEATVRRVLRFLDVDEQAPIELFEANPTVGVRSMRVDAAVRGLYMGSSPLVRGARATAKALVPARVRSSVIGAMRRRVVYAPAPATDEHVMLELRRRYKGEVVALGEHLGRDLVAEWGYAEID